MTRIAQIKRATKETAIEINLNLDGSGKSEISTGIGFFDHMLAAFTLHSGFDLSIKVQGDLIVDGHHTVEDTGIVLGQCFAKALGDKSGIARFGSFYIPMDEALAFCAIDISGRPYLVFQASFDNQKTGSFENCLVEEFFRAFAFNAGITLHVKVLYGSNDHHIIEALFKAVAHALKAAIEEQENGALSTKGSL
jgi:imidazoleglycerol-phosphate dehydratase